VLTHTQVLFICTGNSARSILAEALLRDLGRQQGFVAHSAGSHPTGVVNPLALRVLERHGIATEGLRSKSWNEFSSSQAPALNFAFTVCDRAAGETCPHWPGQPITAHWGVPDPAAVEGDESQRIQAFLDTFITLKRRIEMMLALPFDKLDALSIQKQVQDIGRA
jgi:protein-tyrosine-phosphatase